MTKDEYMEAVRRRQQGIDDFLRRQAEQLDIQTMGLLALEMVKQADGSYRRKA